MGDLQRSIEAAAIGPLAVARLPLALRRAVPVALVGALLLWLLMVAARGALLAGQTAGLPFLDAPQRNFATLQMAVMVGIACLACLAAAVFARALRPSAALPTTLAVGGFVVAAAAIRTDALGAVAVVLALFVLCWLTGDAVLRRLPATADAPIVRLPIAVGLGSGLLGLVFLLLTTCGWLNAATVAAVAVVVLLATVGQDRERLVASLARIARWKTAAPSWWETVVVALAVGLTSYALLAAFLPEAHSDAVRHHLPIAREIWQTGTSPAFNPMWTSLYPIQAHLHYAVAHGFGGMIAAKLVHTAVGLIAIAGVASIGWLIAGRIAATVGAVIFATLPLVLWELGTAYVDLFPVLFTVAAMLCVLFWQRDGHPGWLMCAGALGGFGFAAKMTMGLAVVALVAALFLAGRDPWRLRDRVIAVVLFGLGTVVVVPWLLRSASLTGTVPGLGILVEHATGTTTSDLPTFGLGRSPLDLLRVPWELTFRGEEFNQSGRGDAGILLLMLTPLALFAPRTRALALLALTTGVSYLGWALTAQYTRYVLPTLALAAALAGIGVASVVAAHPSWTRRALALAAPAAVIIGLLVTPLLFLPVSKSRAFVEFFNSDMTLDDYVAQRVGAAAALTAAGAMLPADTPVAYFGLEREGAQIYTEARLSYFGADPLDPKRDGILPSFALLGETPEEVLASLNRLGVRHMIWNRPETKLADWRSTLLSTPFLRTYTTILAGDRGGYLFALRPAGDQPWATSQANLLQDPRLRRVEDGGPWAVQGPARIRKGTVGVRPDSSVRQQVPVTGGRPYLLLISAACADPADRAQLALHWYDTEGGDLGAAEEAVVPGTEGSEQFLWHPAPKQAASVTVELSAAQGARCDYAEAALYALD